MEVQIDAVSGALRDAHGHGLTLKQLAGQLQLGQAAQQPLRRAAWPSWSWRASCFSVSPWPCASRKAADTASIWTSMGET